MMTSSRRRRLERFARDVAARASPETGLTGCFCFACFTPSLLAPLSFAAAASPPAALVLLLIVFLAAAVPLLRTSSGVASRRDSGVATTLTGVIAGLSTPYSE
jgi:hypothetical protein